MEDPPKPIPIPVAVWQEEEKQKQLFLNPPQNLHKRLATKWWNNKNAYALTISPKPYPEDKREAKELQFQIYLRGLLGSTPYWLVPERDGSGRLHYHGCIKSLMGNNYHIKTMLEGKAFCKFKIKPGKCWIDYCFKEPVGPYIGNI